MRKRIRRVLAVALFLILLLGGGMLFGGPIVSGGFWLTSPVAQDDEPVTLPWLQPYHKGSIDFGTGLYVRNDQDLIVQGGDLPIVVQRTYRSEDQVSRAFGVGTSHNGEWYLRGDGERFQWAELILDDGARVRYERTSWGSSFVNAMYENHDSPSVFFGSRIGWTGRQWALRWFDGSVAVFRACSPTGRDRCAIVEMRSPGGRKVQYVRDEETQTLRTIRSGAAEVAFDYDEQHRVARVQGGAGQEVSYEYDEGGRLARATESSGIVRTYTYDARGAMLTIDEPRWHIENSYDAGGRCIRQVTRWPDGRTATIEVTYKLRDGSIVEASESWNSGPKTVYQFNKQGVLESKEIDSTGPAPVVINYHRNVFSNFSTRVSVRCYDAQRRLLRKAEGEYEGDDAADEMAERTCRE